ncbi:triadin [Spodoptera litura]|uniref:Triadin n=1 Tax=Spodoptera litura TaxID=69820 RepID=A0A9J7EDD1_SPOLT|nr:triadin [Spodoptera litura]
MADQVQPQCPESGEIGGGEAIPAPQPPVTEEVNKPAVESSVQPDSKPEEIKESKPEEIKEVQQDAAESKPVEQTVETTDAKEVPNNAKENLDWQQREQELLKKIEELEKIKSERTEDGMKLELKVREEEVDLLKARVRNLETELQAALSKPSGKNHEMIENIKQQHEELLNKARGMIFDKTKMVKNQELQIEALTTQVQSLKDINVITKDLLEIRNSEVKAMEDRLQAMEARFKAEKDRYGLVLQRAQTSTTLNDDLKKEYETQLAIFKELREKYEQRVQALVAENARLKEVAALKAGTSG